MELGGAGAGAGLGSGLGWETFAPGIVFEFGAEPGCSGLGAAQTGSCRGWLWERLLAVGGLLRLGCGAARVWGWGVGAGGCWF